MRSIFQRRHYETLAATVKARIDQDNAFFPEGDGKTARLDALHSIAGDMADALAKDNPNFRRGQFMTACGFAPISD